MNRVLEKVKELGIVPVISLNRVTDAKPLAKALCDGGLPCAEITFRTEAAEESIRILRKDFPEMVVGAGTVLSIKQVDAAIDAGAMFIVSPGLNPKVVEYCISKNITVIPGCSNPSDVESAMEFGLDTVKFFPAEAAGGVKMLKALAAPYSKMKFMPTGGISQQNLMSYLELGNVIACGGSWMVNKDMIEKSDFEGIKRLAEEAVSEMLGFEIGHIGINTSNESEANCLADSFNEKFGFKKEPGNSSIFAGKGLEIMKTPYLGSKGHIAVKTNSIERAIAFLERRGCEFNWETKKSNQKGELKAVYLKEEFAGFAIHLVQK